MPAPEVPPTAEQNRFVEDLIAKAGVDPRTLGPRDANWSLVFEAGVLEVGRQCDLYVDAFLGAAPERRSAVQGPNASVALGLSLFNAGMYPALLATDPAVMRNVVQKGRQAYFDKLARDRTEINSRPGVMLALQGYLAQCSASAVAANKSNFATGAPSVLSPDKQTAQEAAGLLAPGHECGGFLHLHQIGMPPGQGGHGWCQWDGARRGAFLQWAASRGLNWRSDEANYTYLVHELKTTESHAFAQLRRQTSLDAAVINFDQLFERSGVKNMESRLRYARLAMLAFGG